jgi:hypothetical protein
VGVSEKKGEPKRARAPVPAKQTADDRRAKSRRHEER